jgi:parallel beta-helix repeat protein
MTTSGAVIRIGLLLAIAVLGVSLISFTYEPKSVFSVEAKIAANITVPDDYARISWAVGNASAGDTILVRSGVYDESDIVVNKTLTITGESADTTVVDGEGTGQNIFSITADNVLLENFTLQNTNPSLFPNPAVYLYNVSSVLVKNVITLNVSYGLEIRASNFTSVTGCEISESSSGIYLHDKSYNNTFLGNTLRNNSAGITIADAISQFNRVYQNNFVNNDNQTLTFGGVNYFDNGYPSGGNYWSDYSASDLKWGVSQNQNGSDGILDFPYAPSVLPLDDYPLANLVKNLEVSSGGQAFPVRVSTNVTVTGYSFNISEKSLNMFVNSSPGVVGACRVSIPKVLLSCENSSNWAITTYQGGQTAAYLPLEDAENTYLYFAYNHTATTNRVEIRGTNAIPEFPFMLPMLSFGLLILTLIVVLRKLGSRKRGKMDYPPLDTPWTSFGSK